MSIPAFRSIQTRLVGATVLLITGIVAVLVYLSMTTEQSIRREEKTLKAKSFARTLSEAWSNELGDENWNQIRVGLDRLLRDNDDLVYVIVSDTRIHDMVVASAPKDFLQRYVPDVVSVTVSEQAWEVGGTPVETETHLLRDVVAADGEPPRGRRGERIIEVAAEISPLSDGRLGVVRVGVSLKDLDRTFAAAVKRALIVGGLSLLLGITGAWFVARRLSRRVGRLRISAARIASGELEHRAPTDSADEVGALARSFNEMSQALQVSFGTLERTLHSFERFVPEKFLHVIAPEGIENIEVGVSAQHTITILFSDIRGFTSMSERMTPQETYDFLNVYLSRMGKPITDEGGFIDKYIGDAIMALFDGPSSDPAVRAAVGMQAALAEYNREREAAGKDPIAIGVGLHRGEVVMGTVGSPRRIDSTVVGDAVNLASRVEGLTKKFQCGVLVTQDIVDTLEGPEHYQIDLVDADVRVSGKDETVAVYRVDAREPSSAR